MIQLFLRASGEMAGRGEREPGIYSSMTALLLEHDQDFRSRVKPENVLLACTYALSRDTRNSDPQDEAVSKVGEGWCIMLQGQPSRPTSSTQTQAPDRIEGRGSS